MDYFDNYSDFFDIDSQYLVKEYNKYGVVDNAICIADYNKQGELVLNNLYNPVQSDGIKRVILNPEYSRVDVIGEGLSINQYKTYKGNLSSDERKLVLNVTPAIRSPNVEVKDVDRISILKLE